MKTCASLPDDCPFRIGQRAWWILSCGPKKRATKGLGCIVDAYYNEKKTRHNNVGWILLIRKSGEIFCEKELTEINLL